MANHSAPPRVQRIAALFSFDGRIGRLAFLGWYMLLAVYLVVWLTVVLAAARLVRSEVVAMLAAVPVAWIAFVLQVKRLHDMDLPGWHALWIWALASGANWVGGSAGTALDVATYVLFAWMCLAPGSPSPNRFGAVPSP